MSLFDRGFTLCSNYWPLVDSVDDQWKEALVGCRSKRSNVEKWGEEGRGDEKETCIKQRPLAALYFSIISSSCSPFLRHTKCLICSIEFVPPAVRLNSLIVLY